MSDSYLGEIRMFGGNFAPAGWALCDGTSLAIAQYSALFNLIGTTYGGDGQVSFNLPDLRSRVPMHQGGGHILGEMSGSEIVTLTNNQLPIHTHTLLADSDNGTTSDPTDAIWATSRATKEYVRGRQAGKPMSGDALTSAGGGQPHENMPPFLSINFIISLSGANPPRG
jgi:microcystin-dependent protein